MSATPTATIVNAVIVMNKNQLTALLSARAGELHYSYERFSNGSSEYLVGPWDKYADVEGPVMRYWFTSEGEGK